MGRRKLTEEEKKEKEYQKKVDNMKLLLERDKKDLERKNIPEPSYFFNVGDRIVYGNYDWTGVLEIFEGGKYYKLFSVTWATNRNIPDSSSFKIHYEAWYNLAFYRSPEEISQMERFEEDEEIFFSYQQREMNSLLMKMVDEFGIDLNPEYQRDLVWTDDQKYELIESIFRHIDIGKFVVIRRPWGDDPMIPLTPKLYEMFDGKQRLTAIWEYFTGRFQYKGKYFYELHPRDQNHFKYYNISYAEINPLTKEQKYRYFLKLNTNGTPISKEHMEKVKKLWEEEKKRI